MRCWGFTLFLFSVAGSGCFAAASPARTDETPIVIFDTQKDACNTQDFPDEPARAFRDAQGVVHLFDSQYTARANLGPSLSATKHSCEVSFQSGFSKVPNDFDDYEWLTSFYTTDGKNVIALVHEEFHGAEQLKLCPSGNASGCTQTAIVEAFSKDGGYTFTHKQGAADLVASLRFRYQADQRLWYGLMNPTNIISYQNYQYFLVSFITPHLQNPDRQSQFGVCVLRSDTPDDPHSWRAWDGKSFSIELGDPYTEAEQSPPVLPRQPVDAGKFYWSLGSVSWYPAAKSFVLLVRCQRWDKGCAPGAYVSRSTDLINWSKAVPLLLDSQASSNDKSQFYPALLDPTAPDRNFQNVTASPWLLTTEYIQSGTKWERKVLAFPVRLPEVLGSAQVK
jgi:hypothetical protein